MLSHYDKQEKRKAATFQNVILEIFCWPRLHIWLHGHFILSSIKTILCHLQKRIWKGNSSSGFVIVTQAKCSLYRTSCEFVLPATLITFPTELAETRHDSWILTLEVVHVFSLSHLDVFSAHLQPPWLRDESWNQRKRVEENNTESFMNNRRWEQRVNVPTAYRKGS